MDQEFWRRGIAPSSNSDQLQTQYQNWYRIKFNSHRIKSEGINRRYDSNETTSSDVHTKLTPTMTLPEMASKYLPRNNAEELRILHTKYIRDGGSDMVTLTSALDVEQGSAEEPTHFRWIHISDESMDFESFERTVLKIATADGLAGVLVQRLLKRFRTWREKEFVHGKYFETAALRYDGYDPDRNIEQGSAIFFCFPYFSLQNPYPFTHSKSAKHPARTLLQSQLRLEPTDSRDQHQIYRRVRTDLRDSRLIYVPQLWGMLLGKSTIVTASPTSREDLFGTTVQHVPYVQRSRFQVPDKPSIVRFIDSELGGLFFFPMDKCRTWFGLMQHVNQNCFRATAGTRSLVAYFFISRSGELITNSAWPQFVNRQYTGSVEIIMHRKRSPPVPPPPAPPPPPPPPPRWETTKDVRRVAELSREQVDIRSKVERSSNITSSSSLVSSQFPTSSRRPFRDHGVDLNLNVENIDDPAKTSTITFVDCIGRVFAFPSSLCVYWDDIKPLIKLTFRNLNLLTPIIAREDYALHKPNTELYSQIGRKETGIEPGSTVLMSIWLTPDMLPLPYPKEELDDINSSHEAEVSFQATAPFPPEPTTSTSFELPLVLWRSTNKSARFLSERVAHTNSVPPGTLSTQATNLVAAENMVPTSFDLSDSYVYCWTNSDNLIDYDPDNDESVNEQEDERLGKLVSVPASDAKAPVFPLFMWGDEDNIPSDGLSLSDVCSSTEATHANGKPNSTLLAHLHASADQKPFRKGESTLRTILFSIGKVLQQEIPGWLELTGFPGMGSFQTKNIFVSAGRKTLADVMDGIRANNMCHTNESAELLALKRKVVVQSLELLSVFVPADYPSEVLEMAFGAIDDLLSIQNASVCLATLELYDEQLAQVLVIAEDIKNGVVDPASGRSFYEPPQALVDAFIHIIMLLVLGADAFSCAKSLEELLASYKACQIGVRHYGHRCIEYIQAAKYQMMSMGHLDDLINNATHKAVSPEAVLALVIENLSLDVSSDDSFDVLEVYRRFAAQLQLQVNEHPSRRLLQDINYLSEEIRIIITTLHEQLGIIQTCTTILSCKGLGQYPTNSLAFETQIFHRCRARILERLERFAELQSRASVLSYQTVQLVELKQEDNSKLIFIFTIVTAIFLPLSFITSFLGMNTVDIRNSNSTQALFWEIALPFAIGVLCFAFLVAYCGESIRRTSRYWTRRNGVCWNRRAKSIFVPLLSLWDYLRRRDSEV